MFLCVSGLRAFTDVSLQASFGHHRLNGGLISTRWPAPQFRLLREVSTDRLAVGRTVSLRIASCVRFKQGLLRGRGSHSWLPLPKSGVSL